MRQALTVALQSFEGGLVVVSHDRHLIKSVADTLWLVADGKIAGVLRRPGRLPAVAAIARQAAARQPKSALPRPAPAQKAPRRTQTRAAIRWQSCASSSKRSRRASPRVAAERALLEAEIAANPTRRKLAMRRANSRGTRPILETQWMEIGTAIEAAEAATSASVIGVGRLSFAPSARPRRFASAPCRRRDCRHRRWRSCDCPRPLHAHRARSAPRTCRSAELPMRASRCTCTVGGRIRRRHTPLENRSLRFPASRRWRMRRYPTLTLRRPGLA